MSSYFITKGWVKIYTAANFFVLLLNILLDLIYIPKFGLVAASVSTSVAYITNFIIILIYFLRKENLKLSVFYPSKTDVDKIKSLFVREWYIRRF